jgi:PAS domain S-box-containing protein
MPCRNDKLTTALLERSVRYAIELQRMRLLAQEAQRRFQALADSAHMIYFESDPVTKRLLYVSPSYEAIIGQSCADASGAPRAWLAHVHADDRARVVASLDEASYDSLEFRVARPDGRVRWLRLHAREVRDAGDRVLRVVGTAEDVSALRVAERRAAATNRLETLGRLAGGVAHDFNNMLAAIMCEAEQLRLQLDADDSMRSGIQAIIDASRSASHLTRQLLTVGRADASAPGELRVSALVRRVERMLYHLVGTEIELVTNLPDDAGCVIAEASQVEQIVLNLVVNARDAMPNGGRLTIATGNVTIGPNYALEAGVVPGAYVVLSVTDDGVGMSADVRARIFEPFFTTKDRDGGSGLGLCTVRDLVERNGGAISVQTERDRGTTFIVLLPRAGYEEHASAMKAS